MSPLMSTQIAVPSTTDPVWERQDDDPRDDPVRRALSADIHFLGDLLGRTIRRFAGDEAYELVEEVRAATKALRVQHSVAKARALRDRLEALDLEALRTLTRAFG